MLVAAHVLEDLEAKPLVEAQRLLVEDEDHVAQALARPLRLFHQSLEERGADATVLRFWQQRDVEQADVALVPADPDATDRAAFQKSLARRLPDALLARTMSDYNAQAAMVKRAA